MTNTVTFEHALAIARQLSPPDRARLVAQIVTELAVPPSPPPAATDAAEAWARLLALSAEMRATYPNAPGVAAQLEADRRERDTLLTGRPESGDVHP